MADYRDRLAGIRAKIEKARGFKGRLGKAKKLAKGHPLFAHLVDAADTLDDLADAVNQLHYIVTQMNEERR